jgi:serine/threonine protein kinase
MGAVYLASQERPHRQVAVKVLDSRLVSDPEAWEVFLARFRREADATAALDHANIVPIYEFGEQQGIAYLVMPYLSDGSLAELVQREGQLSLSLVARYIEQIAAALDLAHLNGIVHRDVKPSNLLLHPDGRLMLADFGIARPVAAPDLPVLKGRLRSGAANNPELTQAGAAMGTPEYMAPEQARGEQVGASADIYALGIVAYTLLAGEPPFIGQDVVSVLSQQVVDAPAPLRTFRPDLPLRVEQVIDWALEKNPAARPKTARAFARALREASGGRTLAAMATGLRPALTADPARTAQADWGIPSSTYDGWSGRDDDRTIIGAPGLPLSPQSARGGGYPPSPPNPGGAPAWPVPQDQRRNAIVTAPLLVLLGGGIVVLLAIALVVGMVGQNGFLALGPGTGTPGASAGPHGAATPTITPRPSPTATPIPKNWLRVSTTSITLACKSGKRSARITLKNIGPDTVDWRASVDGGFGTGISLNPSDGSLDRGESVTITATNNSLFFGHQGTITFIPDSASAGESPVVQYSTSACQP